MQCLKKAINSKYQTAQQVQFTTFPPRYFDLVISGDGWELNYPHHTFFLERELLFIDLKLGTRTK